MKRETNYDLIKLGINLSKFCNDFDKKKFRLILKSGEVFTSRYLFFYFYLIYFSKRKSKYDTILKNYFESIEKTYPGSSYYLAKNISSFILGKPRKTNKIFSVNLTKNNIISYYKNITYNENYIDVMNIIDFIGPDGSIVCSSSKNNNILCERKDKTCFDLDIEKNLKNYLFNSKVKKNSNFIISVCDVFFERDTDIYPLVEKACKEKKNIILLCRGATKQFVDQIKKTMLRNNILIYVYAENFNNEDPFKFSDFAESLGINILSKEKGNIISRDIAENSKLIENITIYENKIVYKIKPDNKLKQKINLEIKEAKDNDLLEYLRKRKKRVISKVAHVYVPENNKNLIQDFKDVINSYNKIIKHGLVIDENKILHSKICYNNVLLMTDKFLNTVTDIGITLKG